MDNNHKLNNSKTGIDGRADRLRELAQMLRKHGASQPTIIAALMTENTEKSSPELGGDEVIEIACHVAAPEVSVGPGSKKNGLELFSLCDLLAKPEVPIDWVWQDRLAAGTLSLIVSKPKVGKSTMARNLALAVARGESFLGAATKGGPVLYMVLEERVEDMTADFRIMGANSADGITVATAGQVSRVVATLRELKPRLVVVDPMIRLVKIHDQNSYCELYNVLGPLVDVARETGTHILCLHHSPKNAKEDTIDSPLGSTAIAAAMSTVFAMQRSGETRTFCSVQRIGEDMPETFLSFDKSSKTLSLGDTRKEIAAMNIQSQILAALKVKSLTEPEIVDAVNGNTKALRTVLRELTFHKLIVRTGSGKKGDPFRYELP